MVKTFRDSSKGSQYRPPPYTIYIHGILIICRYIESKISWFIAVTYRLIFTRYNVLASSQVVNNKCNVFGVVKHLTLCVMSVI